MTSEYSDLGGFAPIIDETGKITGYKTTVGGADTVFPFNGGKDQLYAALQYSGLVNASMTFEQMLQALSVRFPPSNNLLSKLTFSITGNTVRNGFKFEANGYGGAGSKSGTVTSTQFDITNYDKLKLQGTLYASGPDFGEGGSATLYLKGNNINIELGKAYKNPYISSPTVVQTSLINKDISLYSGNVYLYAVLDTYNGISSVTLNSVVLSN